VLPLIQRDQPDFRFLIAGGVTRPLSLIAPRWQGVSFEGFLPDIRQFYDRIAVAVVPLLCGTGISLKTREALNFGRPVVSTAIGARGLDPLALPGLILAEAPEAFAQAVIKAARMPRNLMETHAPVEMPAFRDALAELMCRHANRATSPETAHGRASRSGERR
jgi:glycosyltransferase involved in cell wall biosynthesis